MFVINTKHIIIIYIISAQKWSVLSDFVLKINIFDLSSV